MKLTLLRRERDELVETLKDSECDEFDAPDGRLLEDCCKGKRLNEFESAFSDDISEDEDPEPILEWVSDDHERFYQICHEIAEIEQRLYKAAFAEVEQRCQI